jgi:hypothetical protein
MGFEVYSPRATARELLTYISTGDRSAMAKVYLLYFARLANSFVHVTGNVDLVEELISDTMLDVWRESAAIAPNTSVSAWVMDIAYIRTQKLLAAGGSTQPPVQASIHRAGPDTPGYTPRLRDVASRVVAPGWRNSGARIHPWSDGTHVDYKGCRGRQQHSQLRQQRLPRRIDAQ